MQESWSEHKEMFACSSMPLDVKQRKRQWHEMSLNPSQIDRINGTFPIKRYNEFLIAVVPQVIMRLSSDAPQSANICKDRPSRLFYGFYQRWTEQQVHKVW